MQAGMAGPGRASWGEAGGSVLAGCGAVGSMVGGLTFYVSRVKKDRWDAVPLAKLSISAARHIVIAADVAMTVWHRSDMCQPFCRPVFYQAA